MFNTLARLLATACIGVAFYWAWHDQYAHAAYAMGLAIFNQLLVQDTSHA